VVLGKKLTILPVEVVVRGYLAGHLHLDPDPVPEGPSGRCMATVCPRGCAPIRRCRRRCHHAHFQAFDGGHDEPLTTAQIVDTGL
jgi:phosphoribosylaminoimidazole-succinocarboxamide synthase